MESILHGNIDYSTSSPHNICVASPSSEENQPQIIGGYFNDGSLCWIAQGSSLTVFKHGTKKVVAYKDFSSFLNRDYSWNIVTCKEYADVMLVGLNSSERMGMICLFNHNGSLVTKAIEIPHCVTCLEPILQHGGATLSTKSFSQNLRWLFGVVAVGTDGGYLYLIDLRLDDNTNSVETVASIEAVPTVLHEVPEVRDAIHQRGGHLAYDLLDQCHENDNFHYVTLEDQIIDTFLSSHVSVTALHFERRCTSLFVGFSFGQFVIYDLQHLVLSFSSDMAKDEGPVIGFAFQEPENDPKCFSYLWVIRSLLDDAGVESSLISTMFQMVFNKKELVEYRNRLVSLYSTLEHCCIRYEVALDESLGLSTSSDVADLLQCRSIEHYTPRIYSDDEYCSSPSTSVFVVAWMTTDEQHRSLHLMIFDINSWYAAHMPNCYRGYAEDETYLAMWNLNSTIGKADNDLLALYTVPSTLHHFRSRISPAPHQFTRPSAYSMNTHCLSSSSTSTCRMPGIQVQTLQHLLDGSCSCLVDPTYVFDQMLSVGLVDQTAGNTVTVERKREYILTSALDHGLFSFIARVIRGLASGEYAPSGCTLHFVMDWAWKTTAIIKDSLDLLCEPIFDCSVVILDTAVQALLSHHTTQLSDLRLILEELEKHAGRSSEQSIIELDVKINVVSLIHGYLKILRWFIGARLLPEQLDSHVAPELATYDEFHFVYKQSTLRKIFDTRRSEIKRINTSSEPSLLMIDGLIEDAGENLMSQWKKLSDDDSAIYPPSSLMALLDMYYVESVDEVSKHAIVTYFLLDILALAETTQDGTSRGEVYEASYNEHQQIVSYFPQTFQLPPATTKLIKAFWLLDHKEFQESLYTFCEAGTEKVSLPWQHRRILVAYILQGHKQLALHYLVARQPTSTSVYDVKLHIDIYIKNGLPHHALAVARSKGDSHNKDVIYSHLFARCYDHGLFHELLKATISRQEDALVVKYFESHDFSHARDLLVLYHLRKSRHLQAIKSYRDNKSSCIMTEHDKTEKRHRATLGHIVQGFMHILPEMQREASLDTSELFQKSSAVRKEVFQVQPLSAILNSCKKIAPLSHSSILSMILNKPANFQLPPPFTPFRKRPGQSQSPERLIQRSGDHRRVFLDEVHGAESGKKSSRKSSSRLSLGGGDNSMTLRRHALLANASLTSSPALPNHNKSLLERRSYLMDAASVLLHTPPIKRKPRTPESSASNLDLRTPQSILKVKLLRGKSPSLPCLSQTSEKKLTTSSSGSLTSLKQDKDDNRHLFGDEGLDSCSSEGETPAWMMSSMTAGVDGKKSPSVKSLMLNPTFMIETPPVNTLLKTFKGLNTPSTATANETPSTMKRLRFFGLNASDETEDRDAATQQLDNPVYCQGTSEDEDVDVTGDITADIIVRERSYEEEEEITPLHRDEDEDALISDDQVVVEDKREEAGSPGDVDSEEPPFEAAPPSQEVGSRNNVETWQESRQSDSERILLRLSGSSSDRFTDDDYCDAAEQIKLDGDRDVIDNDDDDVIEISTDDEENDVTPRENVNFHDYLKSVFDGTSFQELSQEPAEEVYVPDEDENPLSFHSANDEDLYHPVQTSSYRHDGDDEAPTIAPLIEPPALIFQETDLSSHLDAGSKTPDAKLPETFFGLEPASADVIKKSSLDNKQEKPVNAITSNEEHDTTQIQGKEKSVSSSVEHVPLDNFENLERSTSTDEFQVENLLNSEVASAAAMEGVKPDLPATTMADEVHFQCEETSAQVDSQVTSTSDLKDESAVSAMQQITEEVDSTGPAKSDAFIPAPDVEGLLDQPAVASASSTDEAALPETMQISEDRLHATQDTFTNVIPKPSLPKPIIESEFKETNLMGYSDGGNKPKDLMTEDATKTVDKVTAPTPQVPVYILSPPITRSQRKARTTKTSTVAMDTPATRRNRGKIASPPDFIFSPPSTIRTRPKRKRKIVDTTEAKPSKTSRKSVSPDKRKATQATTPTRRSTRIPTRRKISLATRPTTEQQEIKPSQKSSIDVIASDDASQSSVADHPIPAGRIPEASDQTTSVRKGKSKEAPGDAIIKTTGSVDAGGDFQPHVTRSSSRRKEAQHQDQSRRATSQEDKEGSQTKTRTRSKDEKTQSPTRLFSRSNSQSSDHGEGAPSHIKQSSPIPSHTIDVEDTQPIVTRSSSRKKSSHLNVHARKQSATVRKSPKNRSHQGTDDEDSQPIVSRRSFRSKSQSEEEKEVVASKSSSRHGVQEKTPGAGGDKSSIILETKTPSRRRTRASASEDEQPVVSQSSSRTRSRRKPKSTTKSEEEPPVEIQSSSRKRNLPSSSDEVNDASASKTAKRQRNGSSDSRYSSDDDRPSVTRTSSRRHNTRSGDLQVIEEETTTYEHELDVVTESEHGNTEETVQHKRLFKETLLRSGGSHCWSPSNDKIKLIEVPYETASDTPRIKKRTNSSESEESSSRRTTRSGKIIFPITSRRKAKVHVWDKKTKTFK